MLRTSTLKRCTPGDCINQASSATSTSVRTDPASLFFLECDSVDEAMNVMAEFPLAKAGLLSFECIPLGSFINWENLFADEFKNKE